MTRHYRAGKIIYRKLYKRFLPYKQTVYETPGICFGKWCTQNPMVFWHTNVSPNLDQTTSPYNQRKKTTCRIVDFPVPADHRVKLKESEQKDTYFYLDIELKKLCNTKVTIIPIVISALGAVNKGLIKGLKDFEIIRRIETIQNSTLFGLNTEKSLGYLRRLAITQTPVKDNQLWQMWKTLKE